ncbi:MAG: serine aminopeptidase domain-containing protein [Runella sp.]
MKPLFWILSIVLLLAQASQTQAQNLRRRGTLGIEYTEASDSLLKTIGVGVTQGILVKQVASGSTAAALGILPNDILVAINNTDSLYLFYFQQLEQKLYDNEPISVTYLRGKRKSRVVGYVLPKPKESSVGEVIYGEVPYQRGYLRSIVHKPFGAQRFPAILYFQSYECSSVEFSKDSLSPTKRLIDGWVKAGYAVMRVEKPGVGESHGTKDCSRLSYQEELLAFQNAFATLKKTPFIDSTQVFFFGQAVGGMTAPLVAARAAYKPRGIMVYGTVVKPWFEYMIDVFRKQPALQRESPQSIEVNTRMMTPLLFEWLIHKKTANELLQDPDFEAILTSKENPLSYNRGTFFGRNPIYFADLNSQNLPQAWALAAVPTLAIHGEFDVQAISPEAAQNIVQIVNEVRPNKATYRLLKATDHLMAKFPSLEEYFRTHKVGKYPAYVRENFNAEIVEMTVAWMKQQ